MIVVVQGVFSICIYLIITKRKIVPRMLDYLRSIQGSRSNQD